MVGTMLIDWLRRMFLKWPVFCWVVCNSNSLNVRSVWENTGCALVIMNMPLIILGVVIGWVKMRILLAWLGRAIVPSHCRPCWQLTIGAASSSIQRYQWRQPCRKQIGHARVHAFADGCVWLLCLLVFSCTVSKLYVTTWHWAWLYAVVMCMIYIVLLYYITIH